MAGGNNLLPGKKERSAPEFICGHTRILWSNLILHPHRVFNGHGPQFSSNSTLGTAYDRANQHGAGSLDNRLYSTFSNSVLMISTSFTEAYVLVLLNECIHKSLEANTPLSVWYA